MAKSPSRGSLPLEVHERTSRTPGSVPEFRHGDFVFEFFWHWVGALASFAGASRLTAAPAAGTLKGRLGFSFISCLYSSAETCTTLGFGDLTPVGPVRLLAGSRHSTACC